MVSDHAGVRGKVPGQSGLYFGVLPQGRLTNRNLAFARVPDFLILREMKIETS